VVVVLVVVGFVDLVVVLVVEFVDLVVEEVFENKDENQIHNDVKWL